MRLVGISLLVLGILMLIWTGFHYNKKEKIVGAGSIEISANRHKSVSWPPYAGGILIFAGVAMYVTDKKIKRTY